GTTHNVFGIQTGVAIMFLIKKDKKEGQCIIEYVSMHDEWRKEEKLGWLKNNPLEKIHFESIHPDKSNNWINLSDDNDWNTLLPIADKNVKLGKFKDAVFESFSLGVATNRDEWVYDHSEDNLKKKVKYFIDFFNEEAQRWRNSDKNQKVNDFIRRDIKWTSELEAYLLKGENLTADNSKIRIGSYRCFVSLPFYFDRNIIHRPYQNESYFGIQNQHENKILAINTNGREFNVLATSLIANNHFNGDTQCLPLFRYDKENNRIENLTDWGLQQFINHYQDNTISKEEIFHYTYAVLHNPAYRKKYELNLKREFPHLPFYEDFRQWVAWGKALMDLHINYKTVEPFPLLEHLYEIKAEAKRQKEMFSMVEEPEAVFTRKPKVKVKLKADKFAGIIDIDELTFLSGVPAEAWEYKLGNRSALEWILDQYKEKKPGDPTIAEKFNIYLFADYKEKVIDLLKRVCTVSIETVNIIKQMESVQL
ncbi:MAG: type ISP restriction/modification enzyme, partial [Bacteroidota bacterium]